MKALFTIIVCTLLIAACNLNQNSGEAEYLLKKMHSEVMDIHDNVMPMMSDINKLRRQLGQKLEDPEVTKQDSIQQFIYQLEEADNAMMDWMSDFKKPDYSNPAAAEALYKSEKVKIQAVEIKMNSTISKAKAFLSRI